MSQGVLGLDQRTRFIIFTIVLAILWAWASSLVAWGPITAVVIVVIEHVLYVGYILRHRDGLLLRLLVFGIAAGFAELLADRWVVETTGTLVYNADGLFIWRSPAYMPFAWASLLVQFGAVGWWLSRRWSVPVASLILALGGTLNVALYEEWARGAGWWFYRDVRMISHTPLYVVGCEALVVLALPALVDVAARRRLGWSLVLGALAGLWIWGAAVMAFGLLR